MNTEFKSLTVSLQHEANNIFGESGEMVSVAVTDDGYAIGVTWKQKSMTVTPHPRQQGVVRYDLWNGRYGFEHLHSIPSAAVNLLQYLNRS